MSAKERDATACARSAACGQEGGDSFGITPLTYWSTASALTTLSEPASLSVGTDLERAAVGADAGDRRSARAPAARSLRPQSASGLPPELRSFTALPSRWAS